jgi:ferritin
MTGVSTKEFVMISKKMTALLNDQLNFEMHSAYVYLGMVAYASSLGLNGIAGWFRIQVKEELEHAGKFFGYIQQQGGEVDLKDIAASELEFATAATLFEESLKHERKVTKRIQDLTAAAKKENDYSTDSFLLWFLNEQVEEEAQLTDILQKLAIGGKTGNSLLILDGILGQRK